MATGCKLKGWWLPAEAADAASDNLPELLHMVTFSKRVWLQILPAILLVPISIFNHHPHTWFQQLHRLFDVGDREIDL
jgi:hypothetical protein